MKRILLLLPSLVLISTLTFAQCTTSDGTDCECPDGVSTECDLLPDLTLSWDALENWSGGPSEYSQTGNGADNGRLRISGSTPNIGFGAFEVWSTDYYVCGTDTFYSASAPSSTCTDPNTSLTHDTKQLLKQRVYHKNGSAMTYTDKWAGAMTYHPTHNHYHVDDWVTFTLRTETADPNPLNWPIIGDGAKIGFCLMDYGRCGSGTYNGHCRDDQSVYGQGNILGDNDFPNYGHGGMSYSCSPVVQGISVGWTDVYGEHLDGMWIDIPPGTCNGDYWIVGEVDPNGFFQEMDKNNNWTAIPFTLTQQVPGNSGPATITADGPVMQCEGQEIVLTANSGDSYSWSNGDTTQSIIVTESGDYSVSVISTCGTAVSNPLNVSFSQVNAPSVMGDTVWAPSGAANLTATGSDLHWYDSIVGGTEVGTGASFTTPVLSATTLYYVEDRAMNNGMDYNTGKPDNSGNGGYFNGSQNLVFDAVSDFVLKSVKVYASGAGNREVVLRNSQGGMVESLTVNVPDGESRITLNWTIPQGTDYELHLESPLKDLYRNNSGVNFPYDVSGVASVKTSSAGDQYYYHYYDWEIATPDYTCASERTPVEAVINPQVSVDVNEVVKDFKLFPNPSQGVINLSFEAEQASSLQVKIVDPLSKVVFSDEQKGFKGKYNKELDLSMYAKGIYHIDITLDDKPLHKTVVIQ